MRFYFDDLSVGQQFRSRSVELTAEDMIRFAREYDPQFFHVDEEAARDSMFGGLVASGWQTAAWSLRLLLGESDATFAGGVVGMEAQISWKRPVRPGARLRIESEITKITASRSQPDRGFVEFRMTTFDQHDVAVQTITATLVVFRDPARRDDATQRPLA